MNKVERALVHTRVETPLPKTLAIQLASFWEDIFNASYKDYHGVLAGTERDLNRNIIYLTKVGSALAGTSQLTLSSSDAQLGGLGEVAIATSQRRQGIGRALCTLARDEFFDLGGVAIFLGTFNPDAAKLYHSLGWRQMEGSNVMCLVRDGRTPEVFLADYFCHTDNIRISRGSAAQRLSMIPLIVCPHDWRILDANLNLFSTRFVLQKSCMGLFPRYQVLSQNPQAEWFTATTTLGCLVGLASAKLLNKKVAQIDGFSHPRFDSAHHKLLKQCLTWAIAQNVNRCQAIIAQADVAKQRAFMSLGFSESGPGEDIEMAGTILHTLRLNLNL